MSNNAKPPKSSSGNSINWIAAVTASFVVILTLATPMQRYFAQRAQINSLRNQISDANKALEQAKKDLARWNDPTYIAAQARTRLHFVFPGERQYSVLGIPDSTDNSAAAAAAVANQIPSGLPWYSRLVATISSTNLTK
jgi:Septum formation initiator